MSATLLAWLIIFAGLTLLSLVRPVYGIALYMHAFFLFPGCWWWGKPIAHHRWSLIAGVIALVSVLLGRLRALSGPPPKNLFDSFGRAAAILIFLNATLVHICFGNWEVSTDSYIYLAKFVLLYFLIVDACKHEQDLRIILLAIILGAAYIGYEVTINDRGKVIQGRLEGVGAPGATGANQLASLMVSVLPLCGLFFIAGRPWERLLMLPAAPFILNVILLCNSRGAFLACFAVVATMILFSPHAIRKKVLQLLGLGLVALYLLLGDPKIVARFKTTFLPKEERDWSARSRLEYWKAGLRMLADYPLGSGGHGFNKWRGVNYIYQVTEERFEARSVHNGYINEACEWGIQGLVLRLLFLLSAFVSLWYGVKSERAADGTGAYRQLLPLCLFAGLTGFLVTCVFGDFLDAEWGYWLAALSIVQSRLYATSDRVFASLVVPAPKPHTYLSVSPRAGVTF